MRVVVTGAAGYAGSVVTQRLLEDGHRVVGVDNLAHGHESALDPRAEFAHGDIRNEGFMRQFLREIRPDAVVHLAEVSPSPEPSRVDPGRYYRANVVGGQNLLDAMLAAEVGAIVAGSSTTVYGDPGLEGVTEDHPVAPINPYAESKAVFERMLRWYGLAHGIRWVSLRYFNACGAVGRLGENHVPETHLIPILLEAALGRREKVALYGTDYDTPDGTPVRDYVHVEDVAGAFALALVRIAETESAVYNLSSGRGHSTMEVVETVREVTGAPIEVESAPRRPGDPARLVASAARIERELGWRPGVTSLREMVESAWEWRRSHERP